MPPARRPDPCEKNDLGTPGKSWFSPPAVCQLLAWPASSCDPSSPRSPPVLSTLSEAVPIVTVLCSPRSYRPCWSSVRGFERLAPRAPLATREHAQLLGLPRPRQQLGGSAAVVRKQRRPQNQTKIKSDCPPWPNSCAPKSSGPRSRSRPGTAAQNCDEASARGKWLHLTPATQILGPATGRNGRIWAGLVRKLAALLPPPFPSPPAPRRTACDKGVADGRRLLHSSARDQLTNQNVAVKKIMKPFSTPVLAKRTYRELKLLKHLRHENVGLPRSRRASSSSSSHHDPSSATSKEANAARADHLAQ